MRLLGQPEPHAEDHAIPLHQRDEEMLIVDDVPCLECDFCAEQYFDVGVLKRIEADHRDIAEHRRQPARYMQVVVAAFDGE